MEFMNCLAQLCVVNTVNVTNHKSIKKWISKVITDIFSESKLRLF